jgi:hypothetical protein
VRPRDAVLGALLGANVAADEDGHHADCGSLETAAAGEQKLDAPPSPPLPRPQKSPTGALRPRPLSSRAPSEPAAVPSAEERARSQAVASEQSELVAHPSLPPPRPESSAAPSEAAALASAEEQALAQAVASEQSELGAHPSLPPPRPESSAAPSEPDAPPRASRALAYSRKAASERKLGTLTKRADLHNSYGLATLSYPGWEEDAAAAEAHHSKYAARSGGGFFTVEAAIGNMRRKQQAYTGDRSNPVTRALDELIPMLGYPGWELDARLVEQCPRAVVSVYSDAAWMDELEKMRERQRVHAGESSHQNLQALDALARMLDYPRWEEDYAAAVAHHKEYGGMHRGGLFRPNTIRANILRKQQAHSGDRSHPVTRALDALIPTLEYPGWQADVELVAQCSGGLLCVHSDAAWMDELEKMRERQRVHAGDRSNLNLQALDALARTLGYPGWQEDVAAAEAHHKAYGGKSNRGLFSLDTAIRNMRRKQQAHSGDRSHPVTRALDELIPTLNFPGWEADVELVAQCSRATLCLHSDGMWMGELEKMRERQRVYESKHANTNPQTLDEQIEWLGRNLGAPPPFAPQAMKVLPSAGIAIDVRNAPLDELIRRVLEGKSNNCSLSCLCFDRRSLVQLPSSEEIKKRFKELALRLHPDKEKHIDTHQAFVVVRGAYEQLR